MRIACENCDAAYDVPDARLRPGLRLRCGRCATEWRYTPPGEAPQAAVPGAPPAQPLAPVPVAAPPDAAGDFVRAMHRPDPAPMPFVSPSDRAWPSPRHGGALLVLAWVLSFALLGAALAGAVHWRAPIIAAWPPAGRVFAAIGIMT